MSFNHGRHQNLTENDFNHADGGSNIVVIKFENHAPSNIPSLVSVNDDATYISSNGQPNPTESRTLPAKSNNPFRSCFAQALPCDRGGHAPIATFNPEPWKSTENVNGYVDSGTSPASSGKSERINLPSLCEVLEGNLETKVTITSTKHLLSTPMASLDQPNSSCRIYVDHMLPHRYGFPLWLPQPDLSLPVEYREEGIGIGDVGFITEDGGFDFLFNIWLPSDHPINPHDLPEDFYLNERPIKMTRRKVFFDPCSSICSGAKKVGTDWGQRGLSFACTDNEGAILCMPDGSFGEDLKNERHMEEFIVKSAESWYSYATNQGGRAIERNSLYLITGYMKAPSWGIATYGESMAETCNILRFEKGSDSTISSYIWKESCSAAARTGPPPDPELSSAFRRNQCLFVRGFKIALSEEAWNSVSNNLAGALRDETDKTTQSNFRSNSYGTNTRTNASNLSPCKDGPTSRMNHGNSFSLLHPAIEIEKFPIRDETFHPLDAINELLLKQVPTARVALSHDLDWFRLMDKECIVIPRGDDLLSRVRQLYQIICYDGMAVTMRNEAAHRRHINLSTQHIVSPQHSSASISLPCQKGPEIEDPHFPGLEYLPAELFQGFHAYKNGIVDPTDVGEMEGIVRDAPKPPSHRSFKLFSHSRKSRRPRMPVDWIDPFVRRLSQWNVANEIEIRKWVFSLEKDVKSSSFEYPKKSTKAIAFSWLSYTGGDSGLIRGRKKSPVLRGIVLGVEESWWNDLAGRFQVNRRKTTATKAAHQQPIDLRHTLIPYMRKHDYTDQPFVEIHKHANFVAFLISRRYREKRPGLSRGRDHGASIVLLASRTVQESYTSITSAHELETHGLLDQIGDSHPGEGKNMVRAPKALPNHLQDQLPLQEEIEDDDDDDDTFSSRIMKSHWEAFGVVTSDPPAAGPANSSDTCEQQRSNRPENRLPQDPFGISYTPTWVSNPLPCREDGDEELLPYISPACPTTKTSKNWLRKAFSSPNLNVSRSNKGISLTSTSAHIFTDVPPDAPYMLLPLWPGKTDPVSSRMHPFCVTIPHEDRLYLLLWYKSDPDPTIKLDTDSCSNKTRRLRKMASASSLAFSQKCKWNIVLSHFHFSARIVRYYELQGTGIRIPDEGLDVLGPLEDAYRTIPNGFKNIYGGAQLGQYFGRKSGFMFNPEAMEKLDLCRVVPRPREDDANDYGAPPDESHLTPIGRAVLEMAWIGGMALTSFGSV